MKRIFSILGIVATIAFFLPWAKGCTQIESGFQLLILDSLHSFGKDSLSSLNIGLTLLLVPLYVAIAGLMAKRFEGRTRGAFFVLGALSMINIGVWIGLLVTMIREGWGKEGHIHAMFSAKILGLMLLSCIFLSIFLLNWLRTKKFKEDWGDFCLLFPCIATTSFAFSIEPRYYGFYLYFFSVIVLCCQRLVSAVWKKEKKEPWETSR